MTTPHIQIETAAVDFAERPPWTVVTFDLIRRYPLGAVGALVVLVMMFMALFADIIAPYDPEANSFENMFTAPGLQFLLGSDDFGRDIFSNEFASRSVRSLFSS